METVEKTEENCINYLVTSYEDLRDVVTAIEQMIANNEGIEDNPSLRKDMCLEVFPLKGNAGSILKIRLHDATVLKPK